MLTRFTIGRYQQMKIWANKHMKYFSKNTRYQAGIFLFE